MCLCKSGSDKSAFFKKYFYLLLLLIRMMSVMELQEMLREKWPSTSSLPAVSVNPLSHSSSSRRESLLKAAQRRCRYLKNTSPLSFKTPVFFLFKRGTYFLKKGGCLCCSCFMCVCITSVVTNADHWRWLRSSLSKSLKIPSTFQGWGGCARWAVPLLGCSVS